jgi:hypothetical protein
VVFARDVERRTEQDARVAKLQAALDEATGSDRVRLRGRLDRVRAEVHAEHLGAVADEFDHIHSVQRARAVGSVHEIVAPEMLRPYLIDAVERGMERFNDHAAP